MKKILQRFGIIVILFLICFLITDVVLDKWKIFDNFDYLKNLQKKDVGSIEKIKTYISFVWSFLVANCVNLLKIYFDNKKEGKREMPSISILVKDVTCIRKTKRRDGYQEIVLGEGKYFVYIISTLKNVGERAIVKSSLNERKLEIAQIGKDECFDFCFRVCREQNESFKKSYVVNLVFKDDNDIYYNKKLKLKVNEEKRHAEFIVKQKQKKGRYGR